MKWIVGLLIVLLVSGLAGAAYVWISSALFDARVGSLRDQMIASQSQPASGAAQLPEIVRRYAVKAGGQVGSAPAFHATHEAELFTARGAPPIVLKAHQWTGMVHPGIVWQARGAMNGLPVSVVDAYVEGRGELSARLLGTFPVAGGAGADYDKGELMRYLSELPVYPDAILNNTALQWRQIDAQTVEVGARSTAGQAVMRFIFDGAGDIVRMESDDRPMGVDGGTRPTPWHGFYADYRQFGRYRIPAYGEVGWVLDDGLFTYWKGRLVTHEPLPGDASGVL